MYPSATQDFVTGFIDDRMTEDIKKQILRERFARAKGEIASGLLIDGEAFMRDVSAGKYDE